MVVDKYKALVAGNCKLTEETAAIICDWVGKGNYIYRACEAAGIDKETLSRWLKRAEKGEEPFMAFAAQLKEADARGEIEAVNMVTELGQRSWQALMTRLERKYPDRWGQIQRIHQVVEMSPEAKRYLEAHAETTRKLQQSEVIEGEIVAVQEQDEG